MEKLTVKNFGPIKDFTMETNRLTVLIGPQASGKSLLAQLLYYSCDIKSLAAEYHVESMEDAEWIDFMTFGVLSQIRGTIISSFAGDDGGYVEFQDRTGALYGAEVKHKIFPSDSFVSLLLSWRNEWRENKNSLTISGQSNCVYVPSERVLFSVFRDKKESVLYDIVQPLQMRKFCAKIESLKNEYMLKVNDYGGDETNSFGRLLSLQRKALRGSIRYYNFGWLWENEGRKNINISGISSGQMSSWPFFLLASVIGTSGRGHNFFVEEPEIHLHPKAQAEIVNTVAYLLSVGHSVVITTHSPFILYVINNLIQAHIAYDGNPPEGEFSINPDHVAAYCLGENPRSIVKPDTKLLELREIDSVFDKLNVDFERYMDMEFAREGK